MGYVKGLKCRECGREYSKAPIYVCEFCFGPLEVVYNYDAIKKAISKKKIDSRPKNLWRYRELLPIDGEPASGLNSGFSPFFKAERLGKELGVKEIYIKDDSTVHPTLSFKDRVVSVALTKALEFGFDTVACASTGNLANSLAAQSAKAGLRNFIFIPHNLEASKILGSLIYRPNLIAVEGNYDEVNRLCSEIANRYKWAFVNINIRPFYAEGSKTHGYEILEQFGWKAPQHVVSPCAGGSLITKIWKGFNEFYNLGLIDKLETKMYAAQATGCSPIITAIKENSDIIKPVKPMTIAKSLAIGNPADGYYAVKTTRESGGYGESSTDEEIIEAIKLLARTEGVFTETAGGVTLSAAKKLIESGRIPKDESIVVCITGNGLKTQEAVAEHINRPYRIQPNIASFEECLKKIQKSKN